MTALAVGALTVSLLVAPTPASASTACTSMSLDQVQSRILKEVNAARSKAGVRALKTYSALDSVALKWSKAQAAAATMSHNPKYATQIPDGWSSAGENVAFGYAPEDVTGAWMDSKGHRENIERSSFTHIGIGMACSEGGRPYYTQVFGGYKTLSAVTPKVAGSPKVGKTLTAARGTWTSGTTYSYKWYVSGKLVSGAKGKTYTPKASDAGKTVKVKVTGKKTGYAPTTKTSPASPKIAKASTLKAATPKVSGTPKVGAKLSAVPGTWTSGTSYTYRWYANGKAISGATAKSITAKSALRGKKLTVKVTGKKAGYTTVSKVSPATTTLK
jgi:hypothetical protein